MIHNHNGAGTRHRAPRTFRTSPVVLAVVAGISAVAAHVVTFR